MSKFISGYVNEQKKLRKEIVEILWFMRGGISREDAWTLSPDEREDIMEFLAERIKHVKETGMPMI